MEKDPEMIVLGTGTCVSGLGWEKEERWPPGYLIKNIAPELVLLEVSEGIRYRIQSVGEEYVGVSDIIISHTHPDHFDIVPFVQSVAIKGSWSKGKIKRQQLRIIGPKGIKAGFWKLWEVMVPEHPNTIYDSLNLELEELTDNQEINFYGSKLRAYKMFHAFGRIEALAYRLETAEGIFVYSGDSGPCDGLYKAAWGADTFLCEASTDIGEDKSTTSGHLTPFQTGRLAKETGVKRIWLTHYSGKNSVEAIISDCRKSGFKGEVVVIKDLEKRQLFGK